MESISTQNVTGRRIKYTGKTPQTFLDAMGGAHVAEFSGKCVVCNRNTYQVRDAHGAVWGELYDPDWRGTVDAYHASSSLVASEYGKQGADIPLCAYCANTRENYEQGLAYAKSQWSEKGENAE